MPEGSGQYSSGFRTCLTKRRGGVELGARSLEGRLQQFELGLFGASQPIAEQFLKPGPAHGPRRRRLQPITPLPLTAVGGSRLAVAWTLEPGGRRRFGGLGTALALGPGRPPPHLPAFDSSEEAESVKGEPQAPVAKVNTSAPFIRSTQPTSPSRSVS